MTIYSHVAKPFRRRSLRLITSLLLSGVMAFACAGCGGSTAENAGSAAATTTVTTAAGTRASTTALDDTAEASTVSPTTVTPPAADTTTADASTTDAATTARQPQTPAPLTEAQQSAIRQAYRDDVRTHYPDDTSVQALTLADIGLRHIATYGRSIVLFIDAPCFAYTAMPEDVSYEGLTFRFTSNQRPVVFREGAIVTFQKAFENGWLTRDDLADLALHFQAN